MPTDIPTDIPTSVPEDKPVNVPPRKKLRPPLVSALGAADNDNTAINVFDMPDRTPVPASEIMQKSGRRPFMTWIKKDGGPSERFPIYYSPTHGLYVDNQTLGPEEGDTLICKRLSPQFTVRGRPIAGFTKIM